MLARAAAGRAVLLPLRTCGRVTVRSAHVTRPALRRVPRPPQALASRAGVAVVAAAAARYCWQAGRAHAACEASASRHAATLAATKPASASIMSLTSDAWAWLRRWLDTLWRWAADALAVSLRVGRLAVLLGPPVVLAPAAYFADRVLPPSAAEAVCRAWWAMLRWGWERAGATIVKFGQWVSMRRDVFPARLCDELESLTDRAQPHPWRDTERTLREDLGEGWRDVLDVDPHEPPMGTGSIAQVHRARLTTDNGPVDVAVKVTHPGVAEEAAIDMRIMRAVASVVELVPDSEWWDVPNFVSEFENLILKQVDLTAEAHNLRRFRDNFASDPAVNFPAPFLEHSTPRVLIETVATGVPIADVIARASAEVKRRVGRTVCDAMMRMLFVHNLSHGDLHPGNIFVDGVDPVTLEEVGGGTLGVTMIDVGITTSLGPTDWANFMDLFSAIVKRDGRLAGRLMLERARASHCDDPDVFVTEIASVVDEALATGLRLKALRVGALLQRVLSLVCEHRVRIESNFTSIVVSIMVVEAMGRSLDPDQDILATAAPYLARRKVTHEVEKAKGFAHKVLAWLGIDGKRPERDGA